MRTLAGALAMSFVLGATSVALGQEEPNSADVAAARSLGQEGVRLAEAGECVEAIDKLTRAEKLFHAPTTLAKLGECQVQVGKIVDGTENLNRVIREQLSPSAPQAFRDAQERAKVVLAEAKPKIARLKIAVAAPPDAQMTVTIDGQNVPLANLNTNRPTDPGEHTIEASAPGYKTATAKVNLPEGGVDSVALTLEPDPNAPKPAPNGGADVVAGEPRPSGADRDVKSGGSRVPAYVAFGVGAVGLGVGAVTGLMATSKKSELEDLCNNSVCPESARDVHDSGTTLGNVSTVGFIVGAVGVAAGVVLYLVAGPSRTATSSSVVFAGNGIGGRF